MPTSYPIILAHGISPFDRVIKPFLPRKKRRDDRYNYFRNIRSTLINDGFNVFHSRVSWAAELERRARDLKDEIVRITDYFSTWRRVPIIAHSMGGLDSRWMIYRYRMEAHIASLTTLGTPHHGTSYADYEYKRLGGVIPAAGVVGLNIRGYLDLTQKACSAFNLELNDFEKKNGILYQTIAGAQPIDRIFFFMRPAFKVIRDKEGENDGLVSLKSAMWKEDYLLKKIDADHFNMIGWWNRSESKAGISKKAFEERIKALYLEIARGLKD